MSHAPGFCTPCTTLLTTAITKCRPKVKARMRHTGPMRIHAPASQESTLWLPAAIKARAAKGCYLCALVSRSLNNDENKVFREGTDAAKLGLGVNTTPEISAWEDSGEGEEGKVRVDFSLDFRWERPNGEREEGPGVWRRWVSITCRQVKSRLRTEAGGGSTHRSRLYAVDGPSKSTSSAASFDQIQQWLQMCQSHHDCYGVHGEASFRPTRLLDISRGINEVRLLESKKLPSTFFYASLSHCWGDQSMKRLLKDNQTQLKAHIEWSSLPQTFQDALTTCQRLHIPYLWIDSLCIIQDDLEDWEHESARMAQIYANSYLNLSASASNNSHGGLFRDRNPQVVKICHFKPTQDPDDASEWEIFYTKQWTEAVEDSPLNSRAWVYQEQMLSPRNLHFTAAELFWECNHSRASETFPDGLPGDFIVRRQKNRLLAYCRENGVASLMRETTKVSEKVESMAPYLPFNTLWMDTVEDFSVRHLTFETDRLVAMSAIAETFSMHAEASLAIPSHHEESTQIAIQSLNQGVLNSPSNYLAGLWRFSLSSQLLWRTIIPPEPRKVHGPVPYIAPSWSWASTSCSINYAELRPVTYYKDMFSRMTITREREVLTVLHAVTTPASADSSFGSVISGLLTIRGLLFEAIIESPSSTPNSTSTSTSTSSQTSRNKPPPPPPPPPPGPEDQGHGPTLTIKGLPPNHVLKATLDDARWLDLDFHHEGGFYCLPVFFQARENKVRTKGLVLTRTAAGQYRRVGIYTHQFVEVRWFLEMVAPEGERGGGGGGGSGIWEHEQEEVISFEEFLPEWEVWRDCLVLDGEAAVLKSPVRIIGLEII